MNSSKPKKALRGLFTRTEPEQTLNENSFSSSQTASSEEEKTSKEAIALLEDANDSKNNIEEKKALRIR